MANAQLDKDIQEFFDLLMSLDLDYTKKMIVTLQKAIEFREKVDKLSEIEFQRLKAEYLKKGHRSDEKLENDEEQQSSNKIGETMREVAKREAKRLYKKGIRKI